VGSHYGSIKGFLIVQLFASNSFYRYSGNILNPVYVNGVFLVKKSYLLSVAPFAIMSPLRL
jgi:hypothetical protein